MNKADARKIAETITNEQLDKMFQTAKKKIVNWRVVSNVNKGMTKGMGWNILAMNFDIASDYPLIVKTNMIREFGEFLPESLKPKKVLKKVN